MSTPTITMLDLRAIEPVLEMGSGYVLDFTDAKFSAFFHEQVKSRSVCSLTDDVRSSLAQAAFA